MKNLFVKHLLLVLVFFVPLSSNALFEARLTYGTITSKDALTDVCNGTGVCGGGPIPGMVPLVGMGADAIFSPPLTDFGFGLRYEKMELSASSSGLEGTLNMTRTAVIVNYRLFNTLIHLGPIFTYGLSHSGGLSMKLNNTGVLDYTGSKATSYSLGFEVGAKPLIVIPIKIGAEAGFQSTKFEGMTDSLGNASRDVDLTGPYLKLFLGLDI
jgi:hypothetical protein